MVSDNILKRLGWQIMTLHKTIHYCFPSQDGTVDYRVYADYVYRDVSGTFTDYTAAAKSSTTGDVVIPASVGDALYIGDSTNNFNSIYVELSSNGSATRVAEYYNGTAWVSLSITFVAGSQNLTADSRGYFIPPTDWATTTVNSVSAYWIRFRVTAGTTQSLASWVGYGQYWEESKTIYIPENTSRSFESVWLRVYHRQSSTALWGIRDPLVQIRIDGGSWTSTYLDFLFGQTGEHIVSEYIYDLTSFFTSNFSGTSHTIDIRFSVNQGAPQSTGDSTWALPGAHLGITYTATAQDTRIKSVAIPLNSNTASVTASMTTLDSIPQLSTFLPEASVTIRDLFFEITGNTCDVNNPTKVLTFGLDAEAGDSFTFFNALSTSSKYLLFYERLDMSTASTHDFKVMVNNTNAAFSGISPVLYVTYEYDHSTTTTCLNSIQIPMFSRGGYMETVTDAVEYEAVKFFIQEPGTITIKQSAVSFRMAASSSYLNNDYVKGSSGASYTTYVTQSRNAGNSGNWALQHRTDSDWSLARGENTVTVYWYTSGAAKWNTTCAIAYINYTSGKSTSGDENHARTIYNCILPTQNTAFNRITKNTTVFVSIPSTNYYLVAVGFIRSFLYATSARGDNFSLSSESWVDISVNCFVTASEAGSAELFADGTRFYKRFPNDSSRVFDIESSQLFKIECASNGADAALTMATYHTFTYTFSGNIVGYSGDGSGIEVSIFRSDTDERVGKVTTTTGGAYSFTWYDDTVELYAMARQDDTKVGRSSNELAS